MVSDIWLTTILMVRKETRCRLLLIIESTSHQLDFVQPVLTHFSASSLYVARSADVHGSCTNGHLNKCSIVCGSVPQSHMVSLEGLYPHLPSVTLALPTPVLSIKTFQLCPAFIRTRLPPHRLLFLISSKGSFICIIPQTG